MHYEIGVEDVKKNENGKVGEEIRKALKDYKSEVEDGKYPDQGHSYEYPLDDLNEINSWLESTDLEEEALKLKKNTSNQ